MFRFRLFDQLANLENTTQKTLNTQPYLRDIEEFKQCIEKAKQNIKAGKDVKKAEQDIDRYNTLIRFATQQMATLDAQANNLIQGIENVKQNSLN